MTKKYQNIFILSEAGISAESGLSTFRSSNGLWNNHRVEDVATIEGFQRNPDLISPTEMVMPMVESGSSLTRTNNNLQYGG